MRLRLLVPRRGRGRGLGGLAAALVAAAAFVAFAGRDGEPPREPARPAPSPTASPDPFRLDAPAAGPSLALGITEQNPNLVAPTGALPPAPPPFPRWRDALARIEPAVYRLPIVWFEVQPGAEAPPNLAMPWDGCVRGVRPCAPYAGVIDQLKALAARQREGGWTGMLVFTGTPAWAAGKAFGCRGSGQTGAPRPDMMPAYRALVAAVLDTAAQVGAEIRYVSPWNEPNHPLFLSPQRAACSAGAAPRAIGAYARLARALRAELAGRPDAPQVVLGETAAVIEPQARAISAPELIRGLPREMVCGARVWSQHAYVGGRDPVAAVTAALDARRCPREHAIWITETGVGPAPGGLSLARGITGERQGCRLLHQRLAAWHADPRVTLATQYTFREDSEFPTGLVTTDLRRARPALREWQAWGARSPSPSSDVPALGGRGLCADEVGPQLASR